MNDAKQTTLDAALSAAGSKATYAGATTSTLGWLASSEAGVIIGILLGVIGLVINIYFKRREDRRQQAEHDARMESIAEAVRIARHEH